MEVLVFVSRDRFQRPKWQDSIQLRTFEQFADFPEVVKESFFLYLSQEEFQQREKCIEMLKRLMKVPKIALQDSSAMVCRAER